MSTNILPVTGTFLDEISHDIPHQNWGQKEWEKDFQHMKLMGIDTVILIRCGYQQWLTYPSSYLSKELNAYLPPNDLVKMFLQLSAQYGMAFYFGIYDSGKYWVQGAYEKEVEVNLKVIDEVWETYGNEPAFSGWYLSQEVSRKTGKIIDTYARLGKACKAVSGLPVMISPYIDGKKALLASQAAISKEDAVSLEEHQKDWDEILSKLQGALDIVAFQDGHVDYHELSDYLEVNKALAEKYGFESWTNAESFDRDMPIKFLPIKWEKLRLKLQAAKRAAMSKAITFEFSHFMSPQSSYPQAHHLYKRYMEELNDSPK